MRVGERARQGSGRRSGPRAGTSLQVGATSSSRDTVTHCSTILWDSDWSPSMQTQGNNASASEKGALGLKNEACLGQLEHEWKGAPLRQTLWGGWG